MAVPWLSVLWALPIVGAVVVILLPASLRSAAKYAGLAVSLGVLAVALVLAARFDPSGPRYQFVEDHPWIRSFGTGYILGVDGIALAIRMGSPIYAAESVIDEAGYPADDEEEREDVVEQFREFIDSVDPEDFAS